MRITLQDNRRYVLRFDKGEEVMAELLKFVKDQKIPGAHFSGIGTATTLELGYFNEHLKDYRHKQFLDNVEIVSFTGTVALLKGEPVIHAHGAFANSDFDVLGGHVFKMIVLATCEIFLIKFDQDLKRELDPNFNLNLLA